MPRLSLGLGVNGSSRIAPAAPSGIPVASTASVVISNAGSSDGTYAKKIPTETVLSSGGETAFMSAGVSYARVVGDVGYVLLRPNSTIQHSFFGTILGTPYANWVILGFYFDSENTGEYYYETTYTNASTDATNIPTTGWSPSITITAAPSGISLTAPSIYASGLSFQNGAQFSGGAIYNPYGLFEPGNWIDATNTGFIQYEAGLAAWSFYVYSIYDNGEETFASPALVATNTAPATSLPATGWTNTNANLIVSGTLVLSTTP